MFTKNTFCDWVCKELNIFPQAIALQTQTLCLSLSNGSISKIMENGDTLIPCQAVIDYWNGLPYEQGVMTIPRPNHSNQYWLFVSIF